MTRATLLTGTANELEIWSESSRWMNGSRNSRASSGSDKKLATRKLNEPLAMPPEPTARHEAVITFTQATAVAPNRQRLASAAGESLQLGKFTACPIKADIACDGRKAPQNWPQAPSNRAWGEPLRLPGRS